MTAQQLSIFDAPATAQQERARRDAGIARAEGASDAVWKEHAYLTLCDLARQRPTVHVDDLYAVVEWHPASPNAWGAIWLRAIKARVLTKSGRYRETRLPGKHAHTYPIYTSLIYRQERAA